MAFGEYLQSAISSIVGIITTVGHSVESLILAFLSFDQRTALPFIIVSLIVAYFIYKWEYKYSEQTDHNFKKYLKLKDVYLHPSAILDYGYYFILNASYFLFIIPIYGFIMLQTASLSQLGAASLTSTFGTSHFITGEPGIFAMAIYGLWVFLIMDFCHYWVHRTFHRYPWLWEFHKVHHSAEVLVPFTAERIHPIENMVEVIVQLSAMLVSGIICLYIYGDHLKPLEIFGINYAIFLSNILASNLRHTHIWLSFGRTVEHVINSPAQHQIHHSIDSKHYNKNFGTNLSLWDWIFGTLYITTPKREDIIYGLGEKENKNFRTLSGLLFYPFKANLKRIKRKFSRNTDKVKI